MQNFSTQPHPGYGYFFSRPHQPFFLFGVIWAVVVMVLFALLYKGVIPSVVSPVLFHVYSLIFIVFTQFFTGFIFTTFPRFCQSIPIERSVYLPLFYLLQSGALLFVIGAVVSVYAAIAGMVLLLLANAMIVRQLHAVYVTGHLSRNGSDTLWILIGFYLGLLSHALWVIDAMSALMQKPLMLNSIASDMAFFLYLIFVAFVVAQRMVPFFSHTMALKRERFVPVFFALLCVKTAAAVADIPWIETLFDVLLALIMIREFIYWKLPIFRSPAILWVLHLALWWFPAGLLLGVYAGFMEIVGGVSFSALQIHLLSIGFLTTLLIGFATRVTLGHASQSPHADALAKGVFWSIQAVVIIRTFYALADAYGWNMPWLFDLSLTLWLLLMSVWALRYGPVLTRGKII